MPTPLVVLVWWTRSSEMVHSLVLALIDWAPAPCSVFSSQLHCQQWRKINLCSACGPEGGTGTDWLHVERTSLCSSCDQGWELQVDDTVIEGVNLSGGFSQAFLRKRLDWWRRKEYSREWAQGTKTPWMKVVQPLRVTRSPLRLERREGVRTTRGHEGPGRPHGRGLSA